MCRSRPLVTAFAALACGLLVLIALPCRGQYAPPDTSALEGVIVETYYVCDADDAGDVDGGPGLNAGAVVYRVYADLRPGYILEAVYGDADHELSMTTTTAFWNNTDRGEAIGRLVPANRLDENTVAIDSWIAVGAASDAHWGVPKTEDPDGSIVGGINNDGGSNAVPGGLLVNADVNAGVPLTTSDGLLAGTVPDVVTVGLDLSPFEDQLVNDFSTVNGAWAVLGGTTGPDPMGGNKVLLAQITTDGVFSFALNLRVGIPDSLQCSAPGCHTFIDYFANLLPSDTAGGGVAADNQVGHPGLTFTAGQLVDCEGMVGGPALPGTPCDDGVPGTMAEWDANCDCVVLSVGTMDRVDGLAGLMLHPNPAVDLLQVAFVLEAPLPVNIALVDRVGAVVWTRDLGVRSGEVSERIDLDGLSAGVYLLHLQVEQALLTRRVVKY